MDFGSSSATSGTKRSAIDDYADIPSKRSSDDYTKRSSDYMGSSSKRGLDDYPLGGKSGREDYKREVEIRHLPSSGGGGGSSSYHSSSTMHKSSGGGGSGRYDERTSSHSFRRMDDMRSVKIIKCGTKKTNS